MIRLAFVFIFALFSTFCVAAETSPPSSDRAGELQLAKDAPQTYTVVAGDTLWSIAAKFLAHPWRWPEIWRMSKEQIKNPHRIFPGDTIILEYGEDKKPLLRIQNARNQGAGASVSARSQTPRNLKLEPRIYSDQNGQAIPAIPPNVIEPFISAPLVLGEKEMNNAATLIATPQDRVVLGKGDIAYIEGADPSKEFWQIYRNTKPLHDPENSSRILGHEAFYLGTAKQIRVGTPATFEILSAKEEIGHGDRLLPSERPPLVDYIPHKPDIQVDGRIVSIYGVPVHGTIGTAGMHSVVSINRGTQEGIEVGQVLAIERNRTIFTHDADNRRVAVQTPPERSGLLFVFRTFEQISYALVVHAEGVVETNDFVRTP